RGEGEEIEGRRRRGRGAGREHEVGDPAPRPVLAREAPEDADPRVRQPERERVGPEGAERAPQAHGPVRLGQVRDREARAVAAGEGKELGAVIEGSHVHLGCNGRSASRTGRAAEYSVTRSDWAGTVWRAPG